jgi:hypothetical protein
MSKEKPEITQRHGTPVSLAPLDITKALCGLLAIPDPDATKPKRKKAAPADKA